MSEDEANLRQKKMEQESLFMIQTLSDQYQVYTYVFDHRCHQMLDTTQGETYHMERWFDTLR